MLDEIYRPQGWLKACYGFNLFAPTSPAFDQAAAIIGLLGLVNIIAGVWLLRRNHLTAWMTLIPAAALCFPFIAIPFANARAQTGGGDIVVFDRMVLGIPAGLALVVLGTRLAATTSAQPSPWNRRSALLGAMKVAPLPAAIMLALTALTASTPFHNRTWTADDARPRICDLGDRESPRQRRLHISSDFSYKNSGRRSGGAGRKNRRNQGRAPRLATAPAKQTSIQCIIPGRLPIRPLASTAGRARLHGRALVCRSRTSNGR